ncbi:MAG: exo-alpha-sialidase [Mucinivorans sp.]
MKKLLSLFFALSFSAAATAQDTTYVNYVNVPVVLEQDVNPTVDFRLQCSSTNSVLQEIVVDIEPVQYIEAVELYYTGGSSMFRSHSSACAMEEQFQHYGGGQQIYRHSAYASLCSKASKVSTQMTLKVNRPLRQGDNYFYLSLRLAKNAPLNWQASISVAKTVINGSAVPVVQSGNTKYRAAVAVRNSGQDGVHSYRIPGLVTSKTGTLMAVYDIRRQTSYDLQDDIQVGLSRSKDGGRTWLPMQTIIDMRGTDGLLDSQNGVGDPSILMDEATGDILVIGMWTQIPGGRAWWGVKQGKDVKQGAAQVVITRSQDDGKTWSRPEVISDNYKQDSWYIHLQGPGRGITMKDGTLVFPYQFVDSARMPHATIIWSKDHGHTWQVGTAARSNTTEAQVVEITPGELMLNMRDNRGGWRAVSTTKDLGQTWSEHPSSRKALIEPVCMASLLNVPASQNGLGRDVLLFSNPNNSKTRSHISIKASLDGGATWSDDHTILLDQELTWGYSCLTMIDKNTIGILYEGSRAQMTFQAIPLKDIIQ